MLTRQTMSCLFQQHANANTVRSIPKRNLPLPPELGWPAMSAFAKFQSIGVVDDNHVEAP
jgi:hypothetical protein